MPILTIIVQAERSVSMEGHIGQQNRKKLKYLLIPAGIILVSYLFFRYLFPLVWPLVVSMLLALMVYPLVNFFEKKIRIIAPVCVPDRGGTGLCPAETAAASTDAGG